MAWQGKEENWSGEKEMRLKKFLNEDVDEILKDTRGIKIVTKDGKRYYKCPFDNVYTPALKDIETRTYPNDYCNLAIKLDCGHWMFDDCTPTKLNGQVHKNKKIL